MKHMYKKYRKEKGAFNASAFLACMSGSLQPKGRDSDGMVRFTTAAHITFFLSLHKLRLVCDSWMSSV